MTLIVNSNQQFLILFKKELPKSRGLWYGIKEPCYAERNCDEDFGKVFECRRRGHVSGVSVSGCYIWRAGGRLGEWNLLSQEREGGAGQQLSGGSGPWGVKASQSCVAGNGGDRLWDFLL